MGETTPQHCLFAVIAAFNEAKVIRNVVSELRPFVDGIVVVDDGSADETAEQALEGGAIVLRHEINLGQGAALQTGIDFALRQNADLIVTFDADGQHDPDDIARMRTLLIDKGVDIVLGSRFLGSTINIPTKRKLFLKAARLFTNVTTGVRLTDAHNGLRMLTAKAAKSIRITQNRMAHASEIIEQIGKTKLSFVEAPVTIRYTEYSMEKGQKLSGSIRILSDLFSMRLMR